MKRSSYKHSISNGFINDKALRKYNQLLQGRILPDFPLDFIGTMYFPDFYGFKSVLGAGSYAVVVEVVEHLTKRDFAMKVNYQAPLDPFQNQHAL